ncbi:MAG: TonB-dependent receptor, partial [Alistipes sp.]|nr:TonB-dependent receptor [Alistipes sp.]
MISASTVVAQTKRLSGKTDGTLRVAIANKDTSEAVGQAVVMIIPYGVWGITDANGTTVIRNIPAGRCNVQVTLLGYVARSDEYTIEPGDNNSLALSLEPLSLAIDDVVVVAQAGKSGESTASVIGRQAIDHIQATSLKDIMQLLPGQIITENPSLTSVGQFYNRTLDSNDSNNAFGAAIMVDGIPLSNNANLNSRGGSFSTVGSGVDLRSIGTDEIESVEIIRGIASAEYGDLSSGTMIVN